jgi:predicted P-loop ATPase
MTFWVSTFDDLIAAAVHGAEMSLEELGDRIAATSGPVKDALPTLKLARFGAQRSPDGSLRHDANVISATGVEADYDGEQMPFVDAVQRLETAGVSFVAYTSPSNSMARPRWRILAPFSCELPPARRAQMVNRLNGVLGGVLARESWGVSQAFYFGSVDSNPISIVVHDAEDYVDEADELDKIACPCRDAKAKPGKPEFKKLDETELIELISKGENYNGASQELLWRWSRQSVPQATAEANIEAAFDAVPQAKQDKKWRQRRAQIHRWADRVYEKTRRKLAPFGAVVAWLEEQPHWQGALLLNQFTQIVEVSDPFPPSPGQSVDRRRPLREPSDILELLLHLQTIGFDVGKATTLDALLLVAERHGYHPVRSWLEGLKWDGQERIGRLFIDYFPAELPDKSDREARDAMVAYLEHIAACFMVAGVARIFEPGCKHDHLPVIVGPQRWGKSSGLAALMPSRNWFFDDLSVDLVDKDTKEALVAKWLIELAEFPHIKKEIEKVKAFFSRGTDRFRRAYDRLTNDWPRTCFFAATANSLEFPDVTGNRRYWPFCLAKKVDVAALERDRNQLWAEAVLWYRDGHQWWLPPNLETIAALEQESYVEEDIWDGRILEWIEHRAPRIDPSGPRDDSNPVAPFTLSALLIGLGFDPDPSADKKRISKADEMRAARRLKFLGWERDPHRSRAAGRARLWVQKTK